ncbi:hypothetical protein K456DRAFT_252103 [Colletotrichum gloeosporioides 23]|nr:hypothetical protein K456DRAFT_252103 [Colletotrichum gloeosporioides 23]
MARKFFVGGNFKMNGSVSSIKKIVENLNGATLDPNTGTCPFAPMQSTEEDIAANNKPAEVVVSPPAIYLSLTRELLRKDIEVAAQNVFDKPDGAFTGEISVAQLKDSNINWAILGHSERRTILKESDEVVASKTKYATENGVGAIWCCGESLEEREAGTTVDVVVVAYEPIWAIGTGKVATTEQAQEVHAAIRAWLAKNVSDKVAEETRILYGGSVNEKNCKDLAKEKDIDGFLVGGASLKPGFVDIVNAKQ